MLNKVLKHNGNNEHKCVGFLKSMKWSEGFPYDSYYCHDYDLIRDKIEMKTSFFLMIIMLYKHRMLFSVTVFQSYNFLISKFLLENKYQNLVSMNNSEYLLESKLYEADIFYIGAENKGN